MPLPPVPVPPTPYGKHRFTRKRHAAALELRNVADEIRVAFNEAWCGPHFSKAVASERPSTARVQRIRSHRSIHRCWLVLLRGAKVLRASDRESRDRFPTGELLWTRLRKSMADIYGRVEGKLVYEEFEAARIKELPNDAPEVDMLENLEDEISVVYQQRESVMRPLDALEKEELRDLQRRYDHFGGQADQWEAYHSRPGICRLWEYVEDDPSYMTCAVLAVGRAKDTMQRKIMAMCPANFAMYDVDTLWPNRPDITDLGMLGGASLSRVRCAEPELYWSGLDENQAFTSVVVPAWQRSLQAGPLLRARAIPRYLWKKGWTASTKVRPLYKRLAMGGSHSVFILMKIHVRIVGRVLIANARLSNFVLLNSHEERHRHGTFAASSGIIYIHVDDFIIGCSVSSLADECIEAISKALVQVGFVVTVERVGEVTKFVGFVPARRGKVLLPPLERVGNLSRAFDLLSRSHSAHVAAVHTVVSIFVWSGLGWRSSLAAVYLGFRFVQDNFGVEGLVPLPEELRREFRLLRAFLPFLECRLDRWPLPLLPAQDAAGPDGSEAIGAYGAYSLAIGFPPPAVIDTIYHRKIQLDKTLKKALRDVMTATTYQEAVPHTIWPGELFDGSTPWWSVLSRRYLRPAHINLGEARPAVLWLRLLEQVVALDGADVLDMTDSQVTEGALEHGRSPSPPMNLVLRQRAVMEVFTGGRLRPSWTSTLFQPADEGTRLTDDELMKRFAFRRLVVVVRLILVSHASESWAPHFESVDGSPTVVAFDGNRGRKSNLAHPVGRQHFFNLIVSGFVYGLGWRASAILDNESLAWFQEACGVLWTVRPAARVLLDLGSNLYRLRDVLTCFPHSITVSWISPSLLSLTLPTAIGSRK